MPEHRRPLFVVLFVLGVLVSTCLAIATSCQSAATSSTVSYPKQVPTAATTSVVALTVLPAIPAIPTATVPLTVTVTSQVILPTATTVPGHVLVPTVTPPLPRFDSPLSTPATGTMLVLTTTVELQNRVAISVAQAARSLLAVMHQPIDPTVTITSTAEMVATDGIIAEPVVTVTTTSGALPPLPVTESNALPVAAVDNNQSSDIIADDLSANPDSAAPVADGQVRTAHVPILMYHYVSTPPQDADIYRRDLSVPPELFAAHLDRIAAEGYTVIPLTTLVAYLLQGTPLPPKPVVLTFDDGYRDNYENALPRLTEHQMTATFFIVMDFINQERPEYLTWPMVTEMAAAGMSIEAHGVDHTTLRNRSAADLEFQALRSYETIQNLLGTRAHFISYPAGEFDQQTIEVFQSAGYWAGLTTVQGATHHSDDLFRLPRVRVRGTTTPNELARLLALDW
ncbi:MAG: polysaccharide deacetylase family protein [Caldilineaceae bacterium]